MNDPIIQLVFSNAVEGRDEEFNDWYDNVHVPDLLAIPGVLSAHRYDLLETEINRDPAMPAPTHRYLCVYEMEGDIDATMAKIQESVLSGGIMMTDAMDMMESRLSFWSPRGSKIEPA
jgi:hypothetical protein